MKYLNKAKEAEIKSESAKLGLHEFVWNFDKVPERGAASCVLPDEELAAGKLSEIHACFYWEFARESSLLLNGSDFYWRHYDRLCRAEYNAGMANSKQAIAVIKREKRRRDKSFQRKNGLSFSDLMRAIEGLAPERREAMMALLMNLEDVPWQGIIDHYKGKWPGFQTKADVIKFTEPRVFQNPIGALASDSFQPLRVPTIGEMDQFLEANAQAALSWGKSTPGGAMSAREYGANPTLELDPKKGEPSAHGYHGFDFPGLAITAFTIDFARYSDTQIVASFRELLKSIRPDRFKHSAPDFLAGPKRGKKDTNPKKLLRRLGLFRVLSRWNPTELQKNAPGVSKYFADQIQRLGDERLYIIEAFRRMFPFLPAEAKPSCVQRFDERPKIRGEI